MSRLPITEVAPSIDKAVHPGTQSSFSVRKIADAAQALILTQSPEFRDYANNVIANAKAIENHFRNFPDAMLTRGTDISAKSIERAELETSKRGLRAIYKKADLLSLSSLNQQFDVVMSIDNSLSVFISDADLLQALTEIRKCTRTEGIFIATIRDYDALIKERPTITTPTFKKSSEKESIAFQIWNWQSPNVYELHQHTSIKEENNWTNFYDVKLYRALQRQELSSLLQKAGFANIEWQMPQVGNFFQPLVIARNPEPPSINLKARVGQNSSSPRSSTNILSP